MTCSFLLPLPDCVLGRIEVRKCTFEFIDKTKRMLRYGVVIVRKITGVGRANLASIFGVYRVLVTVTFRLKCREMLLLGYRHM